MDDFNSTGGSILNWDGGANWSVENGSIDLVKSGEFGISCLGGVGHCVDLDGTLTQMSAGEILSINLGPLDAGSYVFSYWLSGNQRNDAFDLAVALTSTTDMVMSMNAHLLAGNLWQQFSQTFTLESLTNPVNLRFNAFGADNIGLMLDSVKLERVPEPGTLALLGVGLLGMGLSRRKKKS